MMTPAKPKVLRRHLRESLVSGPDHPPERSSLAEIAWTEALLWLNDRCGTIVSVAVGMAGEPPTASVLHIGDSELQHWSERETPEYVANQMDDGRAGSYRLGKRTLINLGQLAEDSYRCRANNLHLVIDLDAHVSLRITGHKPSG